MDHVVGIVGYRGYSGAELLRILQRHARIEPVLLDHRDDSLAQPPIRGAALQRHAPCSAEAVRDQIQAYVANGVTTPVLAVLPFGGVDLHQAVEDLAPR